MSTPTRSPRLAPLVAATAASQASLVVLSPTVVAVARDLGAQVGAVAQARSVTAVTAILVSVVITPRIDRIGIPRLLTAGAALAAVAVAVVAAAPTLAVFLCAHVLVGVAFAGLLSGGFAGVAAFDGAPRARAMGHVAAANALAWIVVNPVAGWATEALSWRAAEAVPGAMAVLALLLARRAAPVPAAGAPSRLWTVLAHRTARVWIVAELAAYTAWTGFLTFSGAFLIERVGLGETAVGWLLAIGPATYAATSMRSGRLVGHLPRPRLIAVAAVTMGVVLAALLGLAGSWPLAAAGFAVVGVVGGVRTPTSSALGLAQLRGRPGAMMAARTAATQSGYLLGAVLGGAVIAFAGYAALGVALAVVLGGSALLVLRVPDPVAAGQEHRPGGAPHRDVPRPAFSPRRGG